MSLLNEALRKKSGELRSPKHNIALPGKPTSLTKRKTKIYIMVLVFVLVSTLGVLGAINLFYRSDPPAVKLLKTDTVQVQKIIETRKTNHPAALQATPEQAVNKAIKPPAPASSVITSPNTDKDDLILKQKKEDKKTLYQPITAYSTGDQKITHRRNDKIKKSIKKATKTHIDPKTVDTFFEKALTYHRQGKLDEAIRMYQEVLARNPQHFDALFNLSVAHIKTGTFSDAQPLLNKLKGLDPENPQILLHLAIAEIGLKKPQSALSYLDMAENQPDSPRFMIYFHRGVAYSRLNNPVEALSWYKKAEELHPNNPLILFNIALMYDKMQNYQDALKYYSKYSEQNDYFADEKIKVEARVATLRAYQANQSGNSAPLGSEAKILE